MLRVVHPQFSESFGDLVHVPHCTCARSTNRGTASGAPWSCCYLRRFRGNKNRGNITLSEIRKSRRSDILRLRSSIFALTELCQGLKNAFKVWAVTCLCKSLTCKSQTHFFKELASGACIMGLKRLLFKVKFTDLFSP